MYEPLLFDLSESIGEFVGEFGLFERPEVIEVDVQKFLQTYSFSMDFEQLCLSIIKTNKQKYNRPTILLNAPMKPMKVDEVISSSMIGHIVNIDCAIRKVGEVKMEMVEVAVQCKKCGFKYDKYEPEAEDPLRLPPGFECGFGCGTKQVRLLPDECVYVNSQYITAQELQENTQHGKQPKNVLCVLRRTLVDKVNAGERVRLTGIVKIRYDKNLFSTVYLEIVGISTPDEDACEIKLTEEDIESIKQLSCNPNIYDILANSVCPLVYGYEDVKRAAVFQMFGGTTIDLKDGAHIRGNSHVLLCGDPGLAKSKILTAVAELVPNSVYTSGKSSSAAGLTAAAIHDDIDGKWVLEAGALPLADGGIAVVDELDKMTNEDRSALHEAMEQQTITVNKAGISAQLLTRCSLLAAANPSLGKFDRNIPLSNQVDLPPSLLSRFDLIYLMTDDPDRDTDLRVAKHILKSRQNAEVVAKGEIPTDTTGVEKPIDTITFRKYLVYAKNIVPIITDEVITMLADEYVKMRIDSRSGEVKDVSIRITPRQLEALIRLSESSARVRLSPEITEEDAKRALSLYTSAMDNISLATDTSNPEVWTRGKNIILSLIPTDGIEINDLFRSVQRYSLMDVDQINNEIFKLVDIGKIKMSKLGDKMFVVKP